MKRVAVSYKAMPRAVFTRPQVAAVGITESEASKKYPATSQITYFYETAKGEAMQEKEGFVKVVANRENGQILGCHIAGPQASVLIQEVVNSMAVDGAASSIHQGIHIHPALSEVITTAFSGF
jgi:dihydrolipoamide dehydrogenase